jgi:hypothetical protein
MMIGRILSTVLILGVFLAFWQMSGGDPEEFFALLWQIAYSAINFVAQMFTIAWNTVFEAVS